MKKILKSIISETHYNRLARLKKLIFDGFALKSYSQEGEDMILRRIFEKQQNGFYVDVGAHHPKRFSNTYFFYKKGWRGINIDATPGSMKLFKKNRKRDINLEVPISEKEQTLTYYMFNEPALNSFSKELSEARIEKSKYQLIELKELKTQTLAYVLDRYLNNNMQIDFYNVDVEGEDLSVLKSNNWNKYIPKVIIVEILKKSIEAIADHEISSFLKDMNYIPYAKSVNSVFFMERNFYSERMD
jgi:FkbM family methyltransferase